MPYATSCSGETSGLSADTIIYVAPNGSGTGSSWSSPAGFRSALSEVGSGEMILMEPGTYTVPFISESDKNTISISESGSSNAKIYMVAAHCGKAVIDFSYPVDVNVSKHIGIEHKGSHWYFKGIEITRAGDQGIYISGSNNTFENCAFYNNRNTGMEINKGGSHNKVINTDSYDNYDLRKDGGMADGFASKQTHGPGNEFHGCRAWNNSDDGFDFYNSNSSEYENGIAPAVIVSYSWSFENGFDTWGFGLDGNGSGFKMGGSGSKDVIAKSTITHSVAFGNAKVGFHQNNNRGGLTIENNVAYNNGNNFSFGGALSSGETHSIKNNVSVDGSESISNANTSGNAWNASASVFENTNESLAKADRHPDGSLFDNGLFKVTGAL